VRSLECLGGYRRGARAVVGCSDCELIKPILTGGEDYEILCTIAADRAAAFQTAAAKAGIPVAEIGRIVAGTAPPRFLNPEGNPLTFLRTSYSHF
jgi:thiamine-monophosphate kinase